MSKPVIRQYGVIRQGRKVYYNPELQVKIIRDLEGREFEEVLTERVKKPSQMTHGYYRGGLIASCLVTEQFGGWEEEELHDYLRSLFLKRTIEKILPDGTRTEVPHIDSTGDLTQAEMNDYITKVEAYVTGLGIQLLTPEEYRLTKYRIIKDQKP